MTAGDVRRQIVSNALIMFPNIVDKRVQKYPNTPVQAEKIFDVYVVSVIDQLPNGSYMSYWCAQLTHADFELPAAQMFLMSGKLSVTVELALQALFDHASNLLLNIHRVVLPPREGSQRVTAGPNAGSITHSDTVAQALEFAYKTSGGVTKK